MLLTAFQITDKIKIEIRGKRKIMSSERTKKTRSMPWPDSMLLILHKYYRMNSKSPGNLTPEQKDSFTAEMIAAYNDCPPSTRKDVLVPRKGKYLKDNAIKGSFTGAGKERFSVYYNMPDGEGYLPGKEPAPTSFQPGQMFDRIGMGSGRFLSQLFDGTPQALPSRSLPYYIPEPDIRKNPAYHIYKVKKIYSGIEPDCLEDPPKNALTNGIVAPAFDERGGGIQSVIPKPDDVDALVEREILDEV